MTYRRGLALTARRALDGTRSVLLWLGAAIGAASILLCFLGMLAGVRPEVVISGSMAPAIPTGALILTQQTPVVTAEVGDIVTVDRPDGGGLITHRILAIQLHEQEADITLMGDANASPDPWTYHVTNVGKVLISLPGLGTAATILRSPLGLTLFSIALFGLLAPSLLGPRSRRRNESRARGNAENQSNEDIRGYEGGVNEITG